MPHKPRSAPKDTAGYPGSVVEFPRNSDGEHLPNNLPLELSSFVGRDREVAKIEALLAEHRLLTLTGPGGSGKTRLALAVASEVLEAFEDGAWLVELAPLSDPNLVPQAVTSALGVRETPGTTLVDSLRAHLHLRGTLLVLDNCEHLIASCASLAETLLRHCPHLRILATSRESFRVSGETIFTVPPLSLPDPHRLPDADSFSHYEAARLFVDRAKGVKPDFALTEGNALAVAQICYRLDGIPLAIELAAARTRVLSVEQISERLKESFGLLSGGGRTAMAHHGTLGATMDWSHDLLSEEEKVLFRRLSVFAGGFTLEAAEAVGSGGGIEEGEVLDLLTSLVDKSLVVFEERQDGTVRYRLLETVRQYASEKLERSREEDEVGSRHALFFLALAEEVEPKINTAGRLRWLERLENEHDNLRAALAWSRAEGTRGETSLQLVAALFWFWFHSGYFSEGRGWLCGALATAEGTGERPAPASPAARGKALCGAGLLAWMQGDQAAAGSRLEESVTLWRELRDTAGCSVTDP